MKIVFSLILLLNFSTVIGESYNPKQVFSMLNIEIGKNAQWIDQLNEWGTLSQPFDQSRLPNSTSTLPLFIAYPTLCQIPHIIFYNQPTPVRQLNNLGASLGLSQLYLKNDGFIDPLYRGNKRRKLEFELAQALAHGATAVITFGCAGSNHALATSEYAHLLGLDCICMLKPQANSQVVRKNLLLHQLNNTQLCYFLDNDARRMGTVCAWMEYKNTFGTYPYIIPTGGSTPRGAIGFVNAAAELWQQIKQGLIPEPDLLYVPCGSTATAVGLLLGCIIFGLKTKIIAVSIEPEDKQAFKEQIISLFERTNALLHSYDPSIPLLVFPEERIEIVHDFAGPDYAVFTPEGQESCILMKQYENIILEGTYTGKALAALIAHARTGKLSDKTVLFWDTYCGNPFNERIAHADYKKLPVCFHSYFEEEVQELDKDKL